MTLPSGLVTEEQQHGMDSVVLCDEIFKLQFLKQIHKLENQLCEV